MKRFITAVVLMVAVVSARAEMFTFYSITSNDPSGDSQTTGENQIEMYVTETGIGEVSILFTNTGPNLSAISDIYFDVPEVEPPFNLQLSANDILPGPDVDFVLGTRPENLPAGMDPLIAFYSDENLGATSPPPVNGINPYEYLILNMTYTDPPHNFIAMLESGELRVGLHVISMGDDGLGGTYSESFINNIPEPSTALLLGFIALVGKSYRRIFVV